MQREDGINIALKGVSWLEVFHDKLSGLTCKSFSACGSMAPVGALDAKVQMQEHATFLMSWNPSSRARKRKRQMSAV